jgi:hypothetical protein
MQPHQEPVYPQRWSRSSEEHFSIPSGYGDHRIVLMVKDPWWLYTYWEIKPGVERQVRSQLSPEEMSGLRSILRVYDITDTKYPSQNANSYFDITLSGLASNWYVHVNAPNRSFLVEIGLLTRSGRFLMLARSNIVSTPRFGPSEVIDEEWMSSDDDYWKLFGITAGVGMGSSPSGLRQWMQKQLAASPGLFSPGMFSPVKIPRPRGFWFWVDAELIVYGGTDPKATVSIQGHQIKLRPDGTFSIRMALPDGTQHIPVEAVSPDKIEARTITPIVNRRTEGAASEKPDQAPTPPKAKIEA